MSKVDAELDAEAREFRAWCSFKSDTERGPYIGTHQIKAMLKEIARTREINIKTRGAKQVMQHGVFVFPDEKRDPKRPWDRNRIYLGLKHEDELKYEETCGHVSGRGGPRSILKRNDFVERPILKFQIWVMDNQSKITEKKLKEILTLAQNNGLGASRSQGYGKFEVIKFKRISDRPVQATPLQETTDD